MNDSCPSWQSACPILYRFCESLHAAGILTHAEKPEIVASHFRLFIEASHPFDMRQANAMIQVLDLAKVIFFQPRLKDLTGKNRARGMWFFIDGTLVIYIQPSKKRPDGRPTRPTSSIIQTLLHEIGEIILEIGYGLARHRNPLTTRRREWWANRFAGMCLMPPERFARDVDRFGLDLRNLSTEYETSLASTSRQVRDVGLKEQFYYFGRFDLVDNPRDECDDLTSGQKDTLLSLVDRTDGYVVRVRDVVRKKVDSHRKRCGELPMHNLPGGRVYRVMSSVIRECVEKRRPILIENIAGGASYEQIYRDLFGFQDISLLILPYGYDRTRGFFIQAVEPATAHHLQAQAQELGIDAKHGIPWLFSSTEVRAPLRKTKTAQKTLKFAECRDAHLFAYQWMKYDEVNWKTGGIKPSVSDAGDI